MKHVLSMECMLSTEHVARVECGVHGRQTHAQCFIFSSPQQSGEGVSCIKK